MKLARIVAVATCCSAQLEAPAAANACDERYPGSCRVETSTTVLSMKGDAERNVWGSSSRERAGKSVRRSTRPVATLSAPLPRPSPSLLAAAASVPLPPPSPRRTSPGSRILPTTVVDEAFNILTLDDVSHERLETALIKRRDQILGLAPP